MKKIQDFLPLTLRYALRDLRGSLGSFRIVLMCLVLGVGAIAAVQLTAQSVLHGIQINGRTILGGDLVVRTIYHPAPSPVATWLKQRGGRLSQTIEARTMLGNPDNGESTLTEMKAVPRSYPQYGALLVEGLGKDEDFHDLLKGNGILLDPALRGRLNVAVGDRVRMGDAFYTVRGFIALEPDRAGGSRFGLAPRVIVSDRSLTGTNLLLPGSMVYYDLRVRFPEGADIAGFKDALEEAFPDGALSVNDTENAAPQIARFVDRLVLFLTLVGLSALLIGGIGIANGMRAHFETRLKTIAIFKTLGASRNLVTQIYLWQVAVISIFGTVAGLLIGAALPFITAPAFAGLLPFAVEARLSVPAMLVPALFGVLTSFVFSLWPLGQAVATRPLELFRTIVVTMHGLPPVKFRASCAVLALCLAALAIGTAQDMRFAVWFVGGAAASLMLFWLIGYGLSRLAGMVPSPRDPAWRLGIRNLHRPGNATANTLISLGLGLSVMMSVSLIDLNLRDGITRNLPADAPAFFFLDIQPDQKDAFSALLAQQPSAHTIRLSPNLRGRIVAVNDIPAAQALRDESKAWLLQNDRGFTYTDELPAHSNILEGQWWEADYRGPPLISVVDDVVEAFGVTLGDTITVNILGRDITATIANIRDVNWANFTINFAITFAPGVLENAPHSWLSTVVAAPEAEADIQRAINQNFPNVSMIRLSDAVEAASGLLANMATAVRATALVALVTGLLVLAGSLAATRAQRLYDTVILKVLGVRSKTLLSGFLFEFSLLGVVAGGVSLFLGTAIAWGVMVPLMDLSWHFYWAPALITLAAGIGLTVLIGWLVTGKILSAPAAPYLRNE